MQPDSATPPLHTPAQDRVAPDDAHNRTLVAHTGPLDWPAPTAITPHIAGARYNLVVIGGGPAGLVAAAGAAGLGAKVALIERHLLGGDCLISGCVPSKALLASARMAHHARHMAEHGVHVGDVQVDVAAVMARVRRLRADIAPHDAAARFAGLGVDVFLGEGRFSGPDTAVVRGRDGSEQTLTFSRAVIATGARAAAPPIAGLDRVRHYNSDDIWSLEEGPEHLVVVGGGVIGCELAQAFCRLGSTVTLFASADRLLPRDDPDAGAAVLAQLRRDGVTVHLGARVTAVEPAPGATLTQPVPGREGQHSGSAEAITVTAGAHQVTGSHLFIAAGRRPNVERLGLDAAGVQHGRGGVQVDARLRTANPKIYAAGDVCAKLQFTHTADAQARIVLQNALFFGRSRHDDLVIPRVTYTDPEVASVGASAAELAAAGAAFDTLTVAVGDNDRAVCEGDRRGFARVHYGKGGRILGATIVAAEGGELLAGLTLAMTKGLTLADIAGTIFPYPTRSELLKRLGDGYNRTRLTPSAAGWLARLLRWRRD